MQLASAPQSQNAAQQQDQDQAIKGLLASLVTAGKSAPQQASKQKAQASPASGLLADLNQPSRGVSFTPITVVLNKRRFA